MATEPVTRSEESRAKRRRVEAPKRSGRPLEITNMSLVRPGQAKQKRKLEAWECPNGHGLQPRYRNQCQTCNAKRT